MPELQNPKTIVVEAIDKANQRFPNDKIHPVVWGLPWWREGGNLLEWDCADCAMLSFHETDIELQCGRRVPFDECQYDSADCTFLLRVKPPIALRSDVDWRRVAETMAAPNCDPHLCINDNGIVALRSINYPIRAIEWHTLRTILNDLVAVHRHILKQFEMPSA